MKNLSISVLVLVFVLMSAIGVSAHAGSVDFKSIQCTDPNASDLDPIFLSVTAEVPNGSTGIRFLMGNIESAGIPNETYQKVAAAGDVTSVAENLNSMILQGSFGMTVTVDLSTGIGRLSGPVDMDPVTGSEDTIRVHAFAVQCAITR